MAEILRGTDRGVECHIHQFCNDWFMVTLADGRSKVVSPTSLKLDPDECHLVSEAITLGNAGMMEVEFDFDAKNGRFRRKSMR